MNKCPQSKENKHQNAFAAFFLDTKYSKDDFYIDSGCSAHVTAQKEWLINVRNSNLPDIMVANETILPVEKEGEINIRTVTDKGKHDITIKDALYVPGITTNLLSVSQLIKKGNKVIFGSRGCKVYNQKGHLIAEADEINNVYKLRLEKRPDRAVANLAVSNEIWHRRFGHLNYKDLRTMQEGAVDGLNVDEKHVDSNICEVCLEGKQSRLPFNNKGHRASGLLELVHADICGPMETISVGGSRYFLLCIDDYSRMSFVYFLKNKDQALDSFKNFKSLVENQTKTKVKILRTDNGGEFCGREFESFLSKNGIIHQKTNPYTPAQNGMAERFNRTMVEKARCLLFDANLEKKFWAEAVNTAVYLRNRSVAAGLDNKTPFEVWNKRRPNVNHLRIFGSHVMVHVPKEKRRKFDKKSEKMILVGFSDNIKGYRLYDCKRNAVITSRDVIVNEKPNNVTIIETEKAEESAGIPVSVGDSIEVENLPKEEASIERFIDNSNCDDHAPSKSMDEVPTIRKSTREKKTKVFQDYVTYFCGDAVDIENVPMSVTEALSGPDSEQWKAAMNDEMESFQENEAWDLVEAPVGATIVQCKWIFKKKCDHESRVSYRARLVARGFAQKAGIDFDETFSPVIRHSSLRLLFALSINFELNIRHLDVKTAFLNGNLHEDVYMKQPEGYLDSNNSSKVCKLKRAIYGLKQASRVWNQRVDIFFIELGFKKSDFEPCLYSKKCNNSLIFIAVYVDDFLIFSNDDDQIGFLKNKLNDEFRIKDLGNVKQCFGMTIIRDENSISLSQKDYVNTLLKRFNMTNCKPMITPIESFEFSNDNSQGSEHPMYQKLMGGLMYLAVLTRPDIAFSVSFLSQFNNCNNDYHWKCAKRVLRYLQGTKDYCLRFVRSNKGLEGFVDADWGSNKIDRKSYTGFVFKLSEASISWKSSKQKTVALSSTEAEYMALSDAAKEAIYLKNLLYEITGINDCVIMFNDNQGAQKLSSNPVFHERSKHIDIRHHFIRQCLSDKIIKLVYLSTDKMTADVLTKPLKSSKHNDFVNSLGLVKIKLCSS